MKLEEIHSFEDILLVENFRQRASLLLRYLYSIYIHIFIFIFFWTNLLRIQFVFIRELYLMISMTLSPVIKSRAYLRNSSITFTKIAWISSVLQNLKFWNLKVIFNEALILEVTVHLLIFFMFFVVFSCSFVY